MSDWWTEAADDVIRQANTWKPVDWKSAIINGLLRAFNRGKDASLKDESGELDTDDRVVRRRELAVPKDMRCHKCGAPEPWKDAESQP